MNRFIEFIDPTIRTVEAKELTSLQSNRLTNQGTLVKNNVIFSSSQKQNTTDVVVQKAKLEDHVIFQLEKDPTLNDRIEKVKTELHVYA